MPLSALKSRSADRLHDDARELRFTPDPGALKAFLHAPADLPSGAPLIMVLHGCGQTARGHAAAAGWFQAADRFGFAVLAPQQSAENNPNRCFNWFEPGDVARGRGEVASVRAMIDAAIRQTSASPERVFVTGLSAGGAMAAALLAAYPEVFAGGSIVAGLPFDAARNLPEALGLMNGGGGHEAEELGRRLRAAAPGSTRTPRLVVWHGDADYTVRAVNGHLVASQWAIGHGLSPEADTIEPAAWGLRHLWHDRSGAPVVELNIVTGLAHGTPLVTSGEHGLGRAAPFMLNAAVSSTLETLRFWGLASAAAPRSDQVRDAPRPSAEPRTAAPAALHALDAIKSRVPAGVQATIERALRAGGLL